MSEMMVDYAREQADTHSEVSAGTLLGRYYDDDSDSEHPYNQNPLVVIWILKKFKLRGFLALILSRGEHILVMVTAA